MTTTMQFGPEWMRTKHQTPSRLQPPPSPPPPSAHPPPPGASTYSALVSPAPPAPPEKRDEAHPFRYSKEEMLRIYREGGGKGGLGLEVERWEGVVREAGSEPAALREMGDAEKKLFAGPLNSELRRRQSTDYLSPLNTQSSGGDRPRLGHSNSATNSPMRERFSNLMGRRRDGADQPSLTIQRKLSLSSGQGPPASPRDSALPSPRTRTGFTSGFDGVLNGGDSWMARRRTSESLPKWGARGESDVIDHSPDSKGEEIKEEEEGSSAGVDHTSSVSEGPSVEDPPSHHHDASDTSYAGETSKGPSSSEVTAVTQSITSLSISNDPNSSELPYGLHGTGNSAALGPPPGILDVAKIEWSYLDPQGQVQGPFPADVMQKWYDDGYFTPELHMKRTHLDTEWVPVGDLARRSGSDKIFLSHPSASLVPPGLSRRTESPLQSSPDPSIYNAPYQPIPTRSLRNSTLDSYLGSNSNPSDSPSSSFGAGRFGDGSPDPLAFSGRVNNSLYAGADTSSIGRNSGFSEQPSPFTTSRRSTFNEPAHDSAFATRGPFGNNSAVRSSSIDNYGFSMAQEPNTTGWPSTITQPTPGFDAVPPNRNSVDSFTTYAPGSGAALSQGAGYGNMRSPMDTAFSDNTVGNVVFNGVEYGGINSLGNQQNMARPPIDDKLNSTMPFNHTYTNGLGNASFGSVGLGQQLPQSSSLQFAPPPQTAPSYQNASGHPFNSSPQNLPAQAIPTQVPIVPPTNTVPKSPWNVVEATPARRPGPFDSPHPTSHNTVVQQTVTPRQPSPWGRMNQSPQASAQVDNQSPWFSASQGLVDDGWKEAGSSNLTFENVGEHNQQQEQRESGASIAAIATQQINEDTQPLVPPAVEVAALATEATVSPSPPPSKTRRKPSNQAAMATAKLSPSAPVAEKETSPLSSHPKSAWSTEDEAKKNKPSGISLGLREIQEAETKKFEARKNAERERERAARATATDTQEDVQPFTASWGLPTSQAGTRSTASAKESTNSNTNSSGATASASATPVWTNATKTPPAKKTMKEIQEEEEKRKKTAVKDTVAAAARRGYAETTTKSPAPAISSNGVWTTVGPSGKSSAASAPTRPTIIPSASAPSVSTSSSTTRIVANGTPARSPATAKSTPSTPRVDDFPVSPSPEFLKWLAESLKGLNSTVNFEEITSMLLSFPLDPDASTVEIISDLIYANSTTLDGRRFASEFVSKRKADAASRAKGSGGSTTTSGKAVSIADVVKAQPKSTQPEWGGFKVVNKKKKGGRS